MSPIAARSLVLRAMPRRIPASTRGVAAIGLIVGISAFVPGAAWAAGGFDGLFKPAPTTDCATVGGEGGALKIENDVFFGLQGQCRMTGATNVRDMDAVLYDMVCTGGQNDAEWTQRALFMRAADDGLILVWNGFAFKYDRCPANPVEGTVTTPGDIGVDP